MSDNDEPINSIGIEPDFVFKIMKIYRKTKSDGLVERYTTKNQALKVSIFSPEASHPYVIAHYGTNESLRGSIIMPAVLHADRNDTVVTYFQDWAKRANRPIKRVYFLVFHNELVAATFADVFNKLLQNKENDAQRIEEDSSVDEDDLYNETQPSIDTFYPDLK